MKKVITIGEILVEIMATGGDGFLEPGPLVGPYPSGAPAIFIDQVAKLGQPCGMIGCVGDDDFGLLNVERLRADGVDVSADRRPSRHRRPAAPSSATAPTGPRLRLQHPPQRQRARSRRRRAAERACRRRRPLPRHGLVAVSPAIAAMARGDRPVKARGGTVSFDPNIRKEMLAAPGDAARRSSDVLRGTDLFLPSGEEIPRLRDATDEDDAVARAPRPRHLRPSSSRAGAEGASYYDPDGASPCPAFPSRRSTRPAPATASAQPSYVCRRDGMPLARALPYANAAALARSAKRGPMEGTSTFAELDAFLDAQTRRSCHERASLPTCRAPRRGRPGPASPRSARRIRWCIEAALRQGRRDGAAC